MINGETTAEAASPDPSLSFDRNRTVTVAMPHPDRLRRGTRRSASPSTSAIVAPTRLWARRACAALSRYSMIFRNPTSGR
ncbi:hypothetical protein Pyn_17684 [Prunus yedoensis var. nudiflora]|uniref:Uncharacterized protein n=1 Tax=Prunus yedoensis var. nudiflora TaxID=2094558 RepID=A0A314YQM0_PRUYE|nr:hypothetical protein Pyn_17684 [Prunus yedoensis var. nudiflora]